MLRPSDGARSQRGRGWRRLLVVLVVLLGHGLLLGGFPAARSAASAAASPVPPAVSARLLVPAELGAVSQQAGKPEPPAPRKSEPASPATPAAARRLSPGPAISPPSDPAPVHAIAEAPQEAAMPQAAAEPGAPAPEPPVLLAAASPPGASPTEANRAAGDAADAAGAPASGDAVPLYSTRLPPAFTLSYELRRGPLSGSGELLWQPGPPYLLRLEGRVPLVGTVITQTSQGGRDANGLAPLRFTDRRIRRSEQAANFQRERGLVSFSGPSVTHPLVPGAQDRLSWMVQIAGIAEAAPARLANGTVAMFVVGARGDADVWHFRLVGRESLRVGGQGLRTVQLVREPRHPHDTRVEVWLAPDAHHLPVRARMIDERGEAFELMLRELPDHLRQ